MNEQRLQFPGAVAMAATDARLDADQRDIVDRGILMQQTSNTMTALEYLRSRDIDARVIERVLLDPHRRRARH